MEPMIEQESRIEDLAQITVRIRKDQRNRMLTEQRARGVKLADVLRENLDLAFAMKSEFAKIVEGEFDCTNPANAPRLVQSLLFRVEERILAGLDRLAEDFEARFASFSGSNGHNRTAAPDNGSALILQSGVRETVSRFVELIAENTELPQEVWIGAFLEIVPRLDLVGPQQLRDLEAKGKNWLEVQAA